MSGYKRQHHGEYSKLSDSPSIPALQSSVKDVENSCTIPSADTGANRKGRSYSGLTLPAEGNNSWISNQNRSGLISAFSKLNNYKRNLHDEECLPLSTRLLPLVESSHTLASKQRHVGFTLPSPKLTKFFSQLMYSPKARRRVLRDEESCGQEEAELCVEIIKETSTDSWQQTEKSRGYECYNKAEVLTTEHELVFSQPDHRRQDKKTLPMFKHSCENTAVSQIFGLLDELKYKIRHCSQTELKLLHRLFNNDKVQRAVELNHKLSKRLKSSPHSSAHHKSSKELADSIRHTLSVTASAPPPTPPPPPLPPPAVSQLEQAEMRETDSPQAQINLAFRPCSTADKLDDITFVDLDLDSGYDKMNITDELQDDDSDGTEAVLERTEAVLEKGGHVSETERRQLCDILQSSHVNAVLGAHDEVSIRRPSSGASATSCDLNVTNQSELDSNSVSANESSRPTSEVHEMETSFIGNQQVKIITLHKNSEPLGATVRNDGEAIVIARIIKGGIADKTKLLKQGDEILQINGMDVRGQTIDQVADLMTQLSGDLKFVTKPSSTACLGTTGRHAPRRELTVRALFDYDCSEDVFIPCVELGITFHIGDILHVINRDDPHWWQAKREGDDSECLAGLIPSKLFWETREQVRQTILTETDSASKQEKTTLCCAGSNHKNKRIEKQSRSATISDPDPILTYEEVGAYYPKPDRQRPIVLVGCEELRLNSLCERIAKVDCQLFRQPVKTSSHPSVCSASQETPLHYLPHDKFIDRIKSSEFIEYKVVEIPDMHYIGVSRGAVRDVINSQAICILNCQPKNVSKLRVADIKPYIIFVAAPHMERLKMNIKEDSGIEPTNEECKHIIDLSRHNESTYSHMYDNVMTFSDTEQICKDILKEIHSLNSEKQWVPVDWVPQVNGKTNSSYETCGANVSKTDSENKLFNSTECIKKLASPQQGRKKWSSPKLNKKSPKSSPGTLKRLPKSSPKSSYKRLVDSSVDNDQHVITSAEICHGVSSGDDRSPSTVSTLEQRACKTQVKDNISDDV